MDHLSRSELGNWRDMLAVDVDTPISHDDAALILSSAQQHRTPLSEVETRKLAAAIELPLPADHELTIVPYMGGYRTTIARKGARVASED